MIVAQRVYLKSVGEVIAGIILIGLSSAVAFIGYFLEEPGFLIGGIIFASFIALALVIELCVIHHNNKLPVDVIKYKNGKFVFAKEDGTKLVFPPSAILDYEYKLKVTRFFGGYIYKKTTWNYGKLSILLKSRKNPKSSFWIEAKNILEPDRAIDKMKFICRQKNK